MGQDRGRPKVKSEQASDRRQHSVTEICAMLAISLRRT